MKVDIPHKNTTGMEGQDAEKKAKDPPLSARWLWASSVLLLLLLAVIVVGVVLIGVYMTQKHTEAVVEMTFHTGRGEKIQQTVMVNERENMAAFHITDNNSSTTILYDYKQGIVGFKRSGEEECYVMKMSNASVPTMAEILEGIKLPQQKNATLTNIHYDLTLREKAEKTKLGVPINLLCSDQTLYWASQGSRPQQRLIKIIINVPIRILLQRPSLFFG